MSYLNQRVLDRGLECLVRETTTLTINATQPVDYHGAMTAMLGYRSILPAQMVISRSRYEYPMGLVIGPSDAVIGRRVSVNQIIDGVVTADGTAAVWCLVNDREDTLLASGPLVAAMAMIKGYAFILGQFDIVMPGAVA
jgi:hypothetical protein